MRKGKSEQKISGTIQVDTSEFAQKIAEATAAEMKIIFMEFLKELKKVNVVNSKINSSNNTDEDIFIDESIIPTNINIEVDTTNLENATTQQKVVDSNLEKSKAKLANIFNRKK